MAVNAETHRFPGCQEQVMVECLLVNRTFKLPSLKLKDHSGRGGGTNVKAKRWARLAKCHLLGFMQVSQKTHSGSCYHDWACTSLAWSTICHGYGRSSWDAIPRCRATETFWRRGVIVFSGHFQTHDHINVPGYFQWVTEQKPKDMNEGKGFIGRSVRETGGVRLIRMHYI